MSAKLLLVDDDDAARMTLSALLEDEGFLVTEASSVDEARAHLAIPGWEFVLLDQHIGTALGSEQVPLIRRAAPNARVVIVSGSAEDVITAGDAFFAKGGAFVDLLALLRALTG